MNETITVTVDLNKILDGLGKRQSNDFLFFSADDMHLFGRRIDALFKNTNILNTDAEIIGWCPGMMRYSVAWHVSQWANRMMVVTKEGHIIEVV